MKNITFYLFIALTIASCSSEKKEETKSEETSAPKVDTERLKELDEEFRSAVTLEPKKAKEFIGLCMAYADQNPEDKKSPMFLENAALVAGSLKKYRLKTDLFQFILDKHRGYENYQNIIYLQATTWDTEMKNAETAKKFYLMVLEQHKDSGIIESAEVRLATIDSLSYDQHVDMLIKKAQAQLQ